MLLKKKPSELRVVIILLLIVAMISVTGIVSYRKLSFIAKSVSATVNVSNRNSLLLRQIHIDLQQTENDVRSYNLTTNVDDLTFFYTSLVSLERKLNQLEKSTIASNRERIVIDSVILLSENRLLLLKKQLYSGDEYRITDELNEISAKIDESYRKINDSIPTLNIVDNNAISTPKKESIFNRLFGSKSKKLRPTVRQYDSIPKIRYIDSAKFHSRQIQGVLKNTVNKVKLIQNTKLAEKKNAELMLSKEGGIIMAHISLLSKELESIEDKEAVRKIENANKDVSTIKVLAVIISAIISLLLLIVSYLIINYVGKTKKYEKALIEAKQNAEDLAKTKEAFLANMSHEIKTPLNAIYGFTEQILKSKLEIEQFEQLNIVKESADHLIRVISDILDYSKIQSGKLQIENVNFELKRELQNIHMLFVHQSTNKNIDLTFKVDEDVPEVINGSLTKLKQVMYNLIGNAIKFTEKGSVSVIVKKSETDSEFLTIQVNDTGIGIAENKISKLFNEYEQLHKDVDNKFGGTGLGLVITKKILEQMGGSINVKSKENIGTEIIVEFPYTTLTTTDTQLSSIPSQTISNVLTGKRILIVDDEEFNRLLLKAILAKFEASITEGVNGNEAIALIKQQPFDIVLMDIRMPEKSGIEACVEIRQFKKELIILASTALISEEKTNECVKAGFNGFIFKPFTEKDLLENLYKFLKEPVISNALEQQANLNFDDLSSVANGDEVFKKEMIAIFHASINNGLKSISELSKAGEWQQIGEVAHKILPSCKHFEAIHLYNCLKYFESLKDTAPIANDLSVNLQQLKANVDAVNLELQVYL
ncbi:MAG: ATP-binding protein [Bacteroidota bacterium]